MDPSKINVGPANGMTFKVLRNYCSAHKPNSLPGFPEFSAGDIVHAREIVEGFFYYALAKKAINMKVALYDCQGYHCASIGSIHKEWRNTCYLPIEDLELVGTFPLRDLNNFMKEFSCSYEPKPAICPECNGKGIIELLTSVRPCSLGCQPKKRT